MAPKFKFLLVLLTLLGLSGCASIIGDENTQEVPQAQPASWEGAVPGMPANRQQ